jgi:hypothetical protein
MSWYNGSYSILVPVGEESEFATAHTEVQPPCVDLYGPALCGDGSGPCGLESSSHLSPP